MQIYSLSEARTPAHKPGQLQSGHRKDYFAASMSAVMMALFRGGHLPIARAAEPLRVTIVPFLFLSLRSNLNTNRDKNRIPFLNCSTVTTYYRHTRVYSSGPNADIRSIQNWCMVVSVFKHTYHYPHPSLNSGNNRVGRVWQCPP